MTFQLGKASRERLVGVHPLLVKVVTHAIQLTPVDFQVYEGLRSPQRQEKLVAIGASKTLNSKHILQEETGYGHAVDLVPMIDFDGDGRSELRWDWPLCYQVATAMRQASIDLGVGGIRWGGVWDRMLVKLGPNTEKAVANYVHRRKKAGVRAFIDGPHFELILEK